jgi:hypothetical protein
MILSGFAWSQSWRWPGLHFEIRLNNILWAFCWLYFRHHAESCIERVSALEPSLPQHSFFTESHGLNE